MRIKKYVFLLVCISGFSCNQFESFTQFVIRYEQDAKIESIQLDSLRLVLNDPPGEDFSFLEEITIYLNA